MTASNRVPFLYENSAHHHLPFNRDKSMNILDLIYRYDQWGMRQNHVGQRNSNKFDDPNLLLISVGHEAESFRP